MGAAPVQRPPGTQAEPDLVGGEWALVPGLGSLALRGSSLYSQSVQPSIQLPPQTTISLLIGGKLVANCQEITDFPSITGGTGAA